MGKRLVVSLMLVLLLIFASSPVYASGIDLDGQIVMEGEGIVSIEGKLIVPIRPLLREMGYQVTFNEDQGLISATREKSKIEIYLWQPKLVHNGIEIKQDAAPQLIGANTMLAATDLAS
ncbi:hypothetical protein N752_23050 [Desulforamulus aquiferis]|nr:copper amine oxidase N-terminal domain-containing protein [Desulforamulus aquiferis]RYD02892.1 hypothetical protein N752_23050 [Desulforamulus aquiferis]